MLLGFLSTLNYFYQICHASPNTVVLFIFYSEQINNQFFLSRLSKLEPLKAQTTCSQNLEKVNKSRFY
jgi:hypothetical protein